jgi:Tol biopolymer transport system component/DNA-binding winged helix-turn-helix (wHTH) protein
MVKGTVRFGVFEVDLVNSELRKHGVRVRLQDQPFQVLSALLERPGEVVSREELIRRLWADGTNVDFDRSLNAAVTRLRQALSDSADVPRYVETVARRGYRFIGVLQAAAGPAPPRLREPSRSPRAWAAVLAGSLLAALGLWWSVARVQPMPSEPAMKVVPLTSGSGQERIPSFSPDGTQVVYEWEPENANRHIYLKVVGSGDPIPLTSGATIEYGPAWSPDGRLIAFLRQLDDTTLGAFVIPPVGGIERKVTEIPAPQYWVLQQYHRRLDWTPDSRRLIVSAPERAGSPERLLMVSVASGERVWLTKSSDQSNLGDREPSVSPDGRTVAFARGVGINSESIYLLPLSGDYRPVADPKPLASAGPSRSPVWTPDGKEIVYATLNPMTIDSGAWITGLNASDKPRPLLALGRNVAVPAIARTGRIAYSRNVYQGNIWRQEIPSRPGAIPTPVKLTDSSSLDLEARYSPDGSRIAFASNRSGAREIWTCGSDGAHCSQVTTFNASFISGTPRWSPDGKQLVFGSAAAGQKDVYVVDANGGTSHRLTDDRTRGELPSWSRDGKWIYFSATATGRNEIWKIPSSGGSAVQVTRDGGLVAFESPDGRAVYYTKAENHAALFRSAPDGTRETEVLKGVERRGFVVTADRIYYLSGQPHGSASIRRFMLATREDSQIASIAGELYLGLSLSPDGRYLIYSTRRFTSNLMLVDQISN